MAFHYDPRAQSLRERLRYFMESHVTPAKQTFNDQLAGLDDQWAWDSVPVLAELRQAARAGGLWNPSLPGSDGEEVTNLQYAILAEVSGRGGHLAQAAMNCAAPDTGNIAVLHRFGKIDQRDRWLQPLLDGEIRSAFAMAERGSGSSGVSGFGTSVVRDGGEYVLNGRKSWIIGAMNPNARIFIVMAETDRFAARPRRQSMFLVERDTPGFEIRPSTHMLGCDDQEHGGHADLSFKDVRLPLADLIGREGDGFIIARARLGPARIDHCMRSIGLAERAIELMCERAELRSALGEPLMEQNVIIDWIAESRVRIEQLRLLVLRVAWLMDTVGAEAAHAEIQAIKVATPTTVQWILDRAIQVPGLDGPSHEMPAANMDARFRTRRVWDGRPEPGGPARHRVDAVRQRAAAGQSHLRCTVSRGNHA